MYLIVFNHKCSRYLTLNRLFCGLRLSDTKNPGTFAFSIKPHSRENFDSLYLIRYLEAKCSRICAESMLRINVRLVKAKEEEDGECPSAVAKGKYRIR